MKKLFSTLVVVFLAVAMMAQTGLTCQDAIPVDSNYVGAVDGPCELWYTAYTYDLPLNVYFLPDAENSPYGPDVYVDFTCETGKYEDPNIADLVTSVTGFGYDLPLEFMCNDVIREGRKAYDLNIGKFYRDQLTEFGINYNVQAFVKVTYHEGGRISFRPDTLFKNCMENSHYIELGDTLNIEADDSQSVFVAALPDWKKDSIRFVWDGAEPLRMFFATTECNFTPSTTSDYLYKYYDIVAGTPLKMYSEDMSKDIDASKDGGIFYVKMLSSSAGRLIVEKIPMDLPKGNAILLEYDQPVNVAANDQSLYAFKKTWREATSFVGTESFEIQVSNSHLFDVAISGTFVNTYKSSLLNDTHTAGFTSAEMKTITSKAKDNYIYIRFVGSQDNTITPQYWNISECIDNTICIVPEVSFSITKGGSTVYRFAYSDIKGYDLTIEWGAASKMYLYFGDTCSFSMSSSDSHVIYEEYYSRKGTRLVEAATISSWEQYVDADGYLYARFDPSRTGSVIFKLSKPMNEPIFTTITDTLCFGKVYDWNGTIYTASGTYEQKFTALNGADSTVTLNLTILPEVLPTTDEVTVRYDELPYLWNDSAFTESTEYTATLQDAYGCDSVVTLKLTVLEKSDIKTTDDVMLNLASAFKVYTMDHTDWVADDVKVNWEGASPLHVFVAKEEIYNLTPFNRYVLHYEVVPAGEEWVVTKEQMAAWEAEATAAGGKLYVRFLTEKDGRLTTVPMD